MYRDILGFKVFSLDASTTESYSYPVFRFPKTARLRMAMLSTETGVRVLALTEPKGVALPPVPDPRRDALVIEVRGIEQLAARLKAEGLTVLPPTTSKTPEGKTFIEQGFDDYDGHLIVLYEMR